MPISTEHAATSDAATAALDAPPALRHEHCAVARCAEIVSGKWTLLLIRDLASGPRSFSELERSLAGISPRTLCDRLKLLVTHGMASRTRIKALPPRSIYELTERGIALLPMIDTMRDVGEAMLAAPAEPDTVLDIDECCS